MNNQRKIKKLLSEIESDKSFKDYENNYMTGQVIYNLDSKDRVEILLFNGKIHSAFSPAIKIGKDIELYYLNGIPCNSKESWEMACKSFSIKNEKMIVKGIPGLDSTHIPEKLPSCYDTHYSKTPRPEPKQTAKADIDWTLSRHGVCAERSDV